MGLLVLAIALAVAIRMGAIPFHLRVPKLTDVAPPIRCRCCSPGSRCRSRACGIATVDLLLAPLALPLGGEQLIIVAVAMRHARSAAALAAFLPDDLRHATGYLVDRRRRVRAARVRRARRPTAWGPARVWLVAIAATKTAVAAWAAVMEDRFGTRSIPELRGWIRHSPILGAALTGRRPIATFGLPGMGGVRGAGRRWRELTASAAARQRARRPRLPGDPADVPAPARRRAPGSADQPRRTGAAPERVRVRRRRRRCLAVEGARARHGRRGGAVAAATRRAPPSHGPAPHRPPTGLARPARRRHGRRRAP